MTLYKRISVTLVLVLAAVLLAGCGGAVGSSGPPPTPIPTGSGSLTPTTTFQAETGNNTSASANFAGQSDGNPGAGNVSKVDTHSLLYSGSNTNIYANLLGWFGDGSHIDVGYNSADPAQVQRQVEDMISRGMKGAVLDWFGPNANTINQAAMALRSQAESHPGFEFAIMEDVGALVQSAKANGCDATDQLISDLNFIATQFATSPAYTKIGSRPVVFFFGVDAYYIDWNRALASMPGQLLPLFRGVGGFQHVPSTGAFQWQDLNNSNPFDPQLAAQNAFYTAAVQNPAKVSFGSAYKGFNDTLARWGTDRFVHQRCGQTWLQTFSDIGNFYSSSQQLAALQVVTWNDYEEGSEIETGIDNCVYVQPAISGNTLSWSVAGGSENTIDHYTVFASVDNTNLAKLADVPSGTHSLDLSQFQLTSTTYALYVKATGRPSIRNKMSATIAFHAGDQPPVANLSVSQTGPLSFSASTAASTDPDGSIANSSIDFGDGATASGPNASHTYANVGTFDITATVVDNGGASSVVVKRVSAKAAAPGVTIFAPTQSAVVNWPGSAIVASAVSGSPIAAMTVLVDGAQVYAIDRDTVNTVLKIFKGTHHVVVQATDVAGATSSAAVDITAEPNDVPPTPTITVKTLPVAPNTVLACGAGWSDPDGFVNSYLWQFSDGTQASIPGVVKSFGAPGTFSTTLTVTDEFGATGTTSQSFTASNAALLPNTKIQIQSEREQKQSVPIRQP